MAVRLISRKIHEVEIKGAKIFLREITGPVYQKVTLEGSARGQIPTEGKMFDGFMKYCVCGWEGVEDSDGNSIEFSPDLIEQLPYSVCDAISPKIMEFFTNVIRDAEEEGTQLKNLSSTSDSPTPTENRSQSDSETDAASDAEPGVQKMEEKSPATSSNRSPDKGSKSRQKRRAASR